MGVFKDGEAAMEEFPDANEDIFSHELLIGILTLSQNFCSFISDGSCFSFISKISFAETQQITTR